MVQKDRIELVSWNSWLKEHGSAALPGAIVKEQAVYLFQLFAQRKKETCFTGIVVAHAMGQEEERILAGRERLAFLLQIRKLRMQLLYQRVRREMKHDQLLLEDLQKLMACCAVPYGNAENERPAMFFLVHDGRRDMPQEKVNLSSFFRMDEMIDGGLLSLIRDEGLKGKGGEAEMLQYLEDFEKAMMIGRMYVPRQDTLTYPDRKKKPIKNSTVFTVLP